MKESRKNIFHWNHISNKLTEEQIEELKAYYHTYHKKCWSHKQALKNFKKMEINWKLIIHHICFRRLCFKYSNWWY